VCTADRTRGAGREPRPAFIKVWDPFVRLFHWSLVLFFGLAWLTADEWDGAHEFTGYVVATLVGLRVVWGLIGTRHARFSDFVFGPAAVAAYVKDSMRLSATRYVGHNPAGGALILVLLVLLSATAGTGVMMTMDVFRGMGWVEELHEGVAGVMLALVIVHVLGVCFASLLHRENLICAMVTGFKRGEP
jgi:cytochrome b